MSNVQVEELKKQARIAGRAATDQGDQYYQAYLRTLECQAKDCKLRVRIARVLYGPSSPGALQFCPLCGGPAFSVQDSDEGYVESIAQSYGLPVEVMKLMLDEWNPHEHYKFSDFVEEMINGLDNASDE